MHPIFHPPTQIVPSPCTADLVVAAFRSISGCPLVELLLCLCEMAGTAGVIPHFLLLLLLPSLVVSLDRTANRSRTLSQPSGWSVSQLSRPIPSRPASAKSCAVETEVDGCGRPTADRQGRGRDRGPKTTKWRLMRVVTTLMSLVYFGRMPRILVLRSHKSARSTEVPTTPFLWAFSLSVHRQPRVPMSALWRREKGGKGKEGKVEKGEGAIFGFLPFSLRAACSTPGGPFLLLPSLSWS